MRQNISIEGMGCDHCVTAVREALEELDGVTVEQVEIGGARIDVEPEKASDGQIESAIRQAGYEPVSRREV